VEKGGEKLAGAAFSAVRYVSSAWLAAGSLFPVRGGPSEGLAAVSGAAARVGTGSRPGPSAVAGGSARRERSTLPATARRSAIGIHHRHARPLRARPSMTASRAPRLIRPPWPPARKGGAVLVAFGLLAAATIPMALGVIAAREGSAA
jgi:hypothetical protein